MINVKRLLIKRRDENGDSKAARFLQNNSMCGSALGKTDEKQPRITAFTLCLRRKVSP